MRIEHVAFNVPDPAAQADWWVAHLGMRIAYAGGPPVHGRFLADEGGHVMAELYRNEKAPVPDYASLDPLVLHVAFLTEDVGATARRLLEAGATPAVEPFVSDMGDDVAIVRDPWGFPVQLIRRARAML